MARAAGSDKVMTNWLEIISRVFRFSSRISALDRKINGLLREQKHADKTINAHLQNIADLKGRIDREIVSAVEAMEGSVKVNKRLESALEAAQDEVSTLQDVTVQGLINANQVLIKRWESQTQVFALEAAIKQGNK